MTDNYILFSFSHLPPRHPSCSPASVQVRRKPSVGAVPTALGVNYCKVRPVFTKTFLATRHSQGILGTVVGWGARSQSAFFAVVSFMLTL